MKRFHFRYFQAFVALFLCFAQVRGQSSESIGSLNWSSRIRLSPRWRGQLDLQLRSDNSWHYIRNALIRPSLAYQVSPQVSTSLGYASINTYNHVAGASVSRNSENCIWEQFSMNLPHRRFQALQGLRLEQRFMEQPRGTSIFAQRLRYSVRFMIPLKDYTGAFRSGVYSSVGNELFLNVQNKDQLNRHLFDQNRVYLAGGYRLNAMFDFELAYMNQRMKRVSSSSTIHVAQLGVTSRF